ncbi:M23 family metallopeptidase [Brucepastera parasyntrophica]|uniref:M23 family metallopeptidase n=1 Tax=Brucepastera parasyntrophica TaxID=2880008 RepID=UPI00210C9B80|nr:M23 family metallopeptidase [Brucepastera parasyntrophica]ULQ61101.1 M23 family metallopeptidase [Brucepastera parasyntrophica]
METGETEKIPDLYYVIYTVQKGDIVGKIAEEFGVSQDAIISLNNLRNTRNIQIGQLLKIPSMNGIIYTTKKGDTPESIADKYRISLEKIAVVNNITDNIVTPGSMIFLPDAKLDWVTIQEINGDLFVKPLRGGYYISSRYGWRDNPFSGKRTFHNGIDMACSRGTPIYAALDGTVTSTGFDVTYGNYVIISHHSGYQTMYAHMNTILTSKGKRVTTSTRIGTVGNTGQSTGPHLHFTVYKNRATINPATLWN